MSRYYRSFTALGLPPNAVKFSGSLKSIALSRNAQILATLTDRTETIFSAASYLQPTIIYQQPKTDWYFNRDVLVAETETESDKVSVLAAPGGIYRVDIGSGAKFLCDPNKVVGLKGEFNASMVYANNRFDVFNAWLKWGINDFARIISMFLRGFRSLFSVIPVPQRIQTISLPKLPKLPPQFQRNWLRVRFKFQDYRARASNYLFIVMHPVKVEVKGPCSLLVKL